MFKHYQIKRLLVSGLAVAAVSCPSAAQAMRSDAGGDGPMPTAGSPSVQQRLDQLQSNVQQRFAAEGGWPAAASSAPAESSGGFQWGDAGIGAAGAVLLLGGAAAGAGVTRRRRIQRRVAG